MGLICILFSERCRLSIVKDSIVQYSSYLSQAASNTAEFGARCEPECGRPILLHDGQPHWWAEESTGTSVAHDQVGAYQTEYYFLISCVITTIEKIFIIQFIYYMKYHSRKCIFHLNHVIFPWPFFPSTKRYHFLLGTSWTPK